MNDDDSSSLVRSGALHSVSVSEYTGDAKTPKNMIVSHEQETQARKRAFEQQELAALEAKKALATHNEYIAPHNFSTDANIQKIEVGTNANHQQAFAGDSAVPPNVQNISADVFSTNLQKVGTDNTQDNLQFINGGEDIAPNMQNIAGEKSIRTNRQLIDQDRVSKNIQRIATESLEVNKQILVPTLGMTPPQVAPLGTDRLGIDSDKIASYVDPLPNTSGVAKPQPVTVPRTPLTTSEQQRQAKLKREQMNDAFHARLAGIKNTVNTLNSHLTNFEEKVPKEDQKLDKGNPDDFQVNLD